MPETTDRFEGRISDWVLHKDNQIIAFNKPAGLAVQPDRSDAADLLSLGSAYAHRDLYLIHRLDRPVSGAVIFGRKASTQTELTKQFQDRTVEKTYLAIVGNRPPEDAATLTHYLKDERGNRSLVVEAERPGARRAELSYRYLASSERYHLLEVQLLTGRKHQIRAQLAAIGCPVRGDKKYGFKRSNAGGGIDLHSYLITYTHPTLGSRLTHLAPPPGTPVWAAFTEHLPDPPATLISKDANQL